MAEKSRAKSVDPVVVPPDLEAVVAEALSAARGLKAAQFKKALPRPYQRFAKEAVGVARDLAARGLAHLYRKGATEFFFAADPMAELDQVLLKRLREGAIAKDSLKAHVQGTAPAHAPLLEDWLKGAVKRGQVFEHAAAPGARGKRYALEPDVRKTLAPLLTALRKALPKALALGISKQRLIDVLRAELGDDASAAPPAAPVRSPNGGPVDPQARAQFLAALGDLSDEQPRAALLQVRDLRSRLALSKPQFDSLAMTLMREGLVSLHHHDHPTSLSEQEREALVQDDRGTYYIGIATRSGS